VLDRKWILIGLILGALIYGWAMSTRAPTALNGLPIPYSAFNKLLAGGKIERVTLRDDDVGAELYEAIKVRNGAMEAIVSTKLPPFVDQRFLERLEESGVEFGVLPSAKGGWFASLLPWLLFLGVYIFLWSRIRGGMGGGIGGGFGGGGGVGDFLKGKIVKEEVNERPVTFADVAGQDNAKQEVAEVIEFLRDPERFHRVGAEPPRGILLMGPPGTGKTLLARALAGEAGVPFFSISASEFIEMFVGVGASRVRSMFAEAKKRAPCIIFIDELDAVGRMRGTGFGGGNDEREQTLNQILSEMDGFHGHEEVVVLSATNRPDVLDPALLRPGRFDRHVTLDLPDKASREAILRVHVRGKPLAEDVDPAVIAAGTPGFSGADLKNLVNEAAIACVRSDETAISMAHFDAMRDRVMLGSERKLIIQPDEKHRLAVHEAGHTAAAHYLPNADPLYKVTIIPRGRALGGTHMLPEEERHTLAVDYLGDRLAVLLGGRAAETAFLGNVSSGADDDIRQATKLARAMVARWGNRGCRRWTVALLQSLRDPGGPP
jgi:cell division protease FtsH